MFSYDIQTKFTNALKERLILDEILKYVCTRVRAHKSYSI